MSEVLNFQWHFTNRCNLRCRHCYQDVFLDTSYVDPVLVGRRLLDDLARHNLKATFALTGGEPLLVPDKLFALLELLEIHPSAKEVSIITNATLFNEELLAGFSSFEKLSSFKISLEGAGPESNDFIRGRGNFEKVVENLRMVCGWGRFEVYVMYTLHRNNLLEWKALFPLLDELGVKGLILERFIPEGRGKLMKEMVLDRSMWRELLQMLISFCQLDEMDPAQLLPYKAFMISVKERSLFGALCELGSSFCIMPDSALFPCRRLPLPLGYLDREDFMDILKSNALLSSLRDKSKMGGKCRDCSFDFCVGCRALAYALFGDPLAEDIQCFLEVF
ncbi:MAG: radical SAM protein [Candidatus Atribacteria bacterium]|nr:radical SAM protein [Candidatus Atribacteria bacterium]MCD6350454.1 radical SAM protein [Candidatus Atribacteria bacterium]